MFGGSITLNSSKSKNSLDDSTYILPGKCPAAFEYTAGLVCRIPDSAKEEVEKRNGLKFDLELARKQHERYIITLRKLKVNLFELEADETKPLLLFLDRKAVVRDGIAFIPRPPVADDQWEEEVTLIKRILGGGLGQEIVEMTEKGATLDGGDVLFTGKEFFVGLSSRTNQKGANSLANAFPNYPVSGIKVNGHLHLKSMMSMAGPGIIAVGSSDHSQKAIRQIKKVSNFDYTTVTLPDDAAANCVYINKTLLHCSQDEFPESYKVFAEKFPKTPRVAIPNNELFKVDGALTCKSLLICKKPKV
ncbi:N(G),N(G)-dimethylarginine dimethylaminohydrolase 1-like isoform X1 [Apostichopus japonicus]|uniref:N(G),N(G)-dimethylarginine dimethylaminohydrolase 1-like isoform X1 n=1 Tax=Stichopus japonicus TaxID=307972 RepID=UPI003AB5BC0A